MVKKTFKNSINPAMQFISVVDDAAIAEEPQAKEEKRTPAIKEGYKVDYGIIEKKSRRMQLLVQPSLYEKIKAQAMAEGSSVNDYIHQILESATRGE